MVLLLPLAVNQNQLHIVVVVVVVVDHLTHLFYHDHNFETTITSMMIEISWLNIKSEIPTTIIDESAQRIIEPITRHVFT